MGIGNPTTIRNILPVILITVILVCHLRAADIVLVKGTSSAGPSERNYANYVFNLMERRLKKFGISFDTTDDDNMAKAFSKNVSIAIFPYNPNFSNSQRAAIKAFLTNNGKIIVFYSSDPVLAEMMGIKLGSYRNSDKYGRWSAVRFNKEAPAGTPAVMRQETRNIWTVYPADKNSRIIASWENSKGVLLEDPAVVRSDKGFWMTHVLLDDCDTMAKEQMLAALIGAIKPALGGQIAGTIAENLRNDNHVKNAKHEFSKRKNDSTELKQISDKLNRVELDLSTAIKNGKYAQALDLVAEYHDAVFTAAAMMQEKRTGEFAGVWDHSGLGLYPGE